MQLIEQYGLEDTFVFHEPCSNIFEKYQESDIFVLPSINEGFPNVLCEAMSCGLPILGTDVCDNSSIVRHEENGYLIPSGDSIQLTDQSGSRGLLGEITFYPTCGLGGLILKNMILNWVY